MEGREENQQMNKDVRRQAEERRMLLSREVSYYSQVGGRMRIETALRSKERDKEKLLVTLRCFSTLKHRQRRVSDIQNNCAQKSGYESKWEKGQMQKQYVG